MRSYPILLLASALVLGLAGCASKGGSSQPAPGASASNPYSSAYLSLDKPTVALQPDADGPKLFRGNNKDTDNNRMLVKGFDMLGYSSFDGKQVEPALALEQARKLKADLVLVYTQQSANTPPSVKVQQLREQALKIKKDPNAPTPPADDSPTYSYYASYWVKLAPPVIGVHVKGTSKSVPAKGLTVLAVVEGSPAFKAKLREGDLLKSMGGIALTRTDALSQVVKQYAGKTIDVLYERDGAPAKASMTLNARNP